MPPIRYVRPEGGAAPKSRYLAKRRRPRAPWILGPILHLRRRQEGSEPMITSTEICAANVLIVDDNEDNVLLLKEIFCGAGYSSVAARS